jgi:uncharacterized repeat protein (TIGR03803 family)
MTRVGGANGYGSIFKITPNGTETVFWSFGGDVDGQYPFGSLIQASDGNFTHWVEGTSAKTHRI